MTQDDQASLKELWARSAKREWTLEELQRIQALMRDPNWLLYQTKCLESLKRMTESEVWRRDNDFPQYCYLRGMHDAAERLLRFPDEIALTIKAKQEESEK